MHEPTRIGTGRFTHQRSVSSEFPPAQSTGEAGAGSDPAVLESGMHGFTKSGNVRSRSGQNMEKMVGR